MAVEGTKIREMMEGKTLEKDNIKKMYDMVQNASEPEDKKKVMKHSVFFIGQQTTVNSQKTTDNSQQSKKNGRKNSQLSFVCCLLSLVFHPFSVVLIIIPNQNKYPACSCQKSRCST